MCLLLYRHPHPEHREVHRDEHEGDDDADEEDEGGFEGVVYLLEFVVEFGGGVVTERTEHGVEGVGLLAHAQQHDELPVIYLGMHGKAGVEQAPVLDYVAGPVQRFPYGVEADRVRHQPEGLEDGHVGAHQQVQQAAQT